MGGVNRLYILGCISSVVVPMWQIAEWSSRWFQSLLLRVLVFVPFAVALAAVTFFVTLLAHLATVAVFRWTWLAFTFAFLASLLPWAAAFLTCYDHPYEFPLHYYGAAILTAAVYVLDSVFYARAPRDHEHLQRS